jgi:hypothetical protein
MRRAGAIFRSAWVIALICAFGVRALCPPGWMPNPDPRSGAWIVICTGHGPLIPHGEAGRGGAPGKERGQSDHCAFAGFAQGLAPRPSAALGPAPVRVAEQAVAFPADNGLAALDRWRGPSARGPPLQA